MIANVPSDDRLIIHIDTRGPNDAQLTLVFATAVLNELRAQGFREMELVGIRPGSLTIEYLSLAGATLGAVGAAVGAVGAGLGLAAAVLTLTKSMKNRETPVAKAAVELMDKTDATRITFTVATQVIIVQRQEIIVKGAEPIAPSAVKGDLADDDVAALRKTELNNTGGVRLKWDKDYAVTPNEWHSSRKGIYDIRGVYSDVRGRLGVTLDIGQYYSLDRLRGRLPFRHGDSVVVSGNVLPAGSNGGVETLIATNLTIASPDPTHVAPGEEPPIESKAGTESDDGYVDGYEDDQSTETEAFAKSEPEYDPHADESLHDLRMAELINTGAVALDFEYDFAPNGPPGRHPGPESTWVGEYSLHNDQPAVAIQGLVYEFYPVRGELPFERGEKIGIEGYTIDQTDADGRPIIVPTRILRMPDDAQDAGK